ncbi:CLUMA_CG014347, isoform A [Clunio marinus]|uniref:General transcription factor IIH subunit 3 n=1 Tax=Clunio marinus TaxID=568069 RepID=A0A1J1ISF1_9DIPT|nr:CLUMA_CG014347, isoform A [Clunio marinus]
MNELNADDPSLLVIALDTNPSQSILKRKPNLLTNILNSISAFGNSHLMQKPQNKLAVIGCHHHTSKFLYPSTDKSLEVRQIDGQYEYFTLVEKSIKTNLADMITNAPKVASNNESMLAGCLAMALCYITRIKKSQPPGCNLNTRILVITGSEDSAHQYMTYMNVFFTAQKEKVVIDICALDNTLVLLQQGCDITGGQYLKVPQIEGLLEYLLWIFLPDPAIRSKLALPPPVKVDYRAACFCHRELIDIGFVCSVCLSIFCKFSPICTTCSTVFKVPVPLKPKKKKIKT